MALVTDLRARINRAVNSFSISTAEQEYLLAIGVGLGMPKRRLETFSTYRSRIVAVAQSANSGSTIGFISSAIQAYLGSNAPYIVAPNVSSTSWILGNMTASVLGSTTVL